MSDKKRPFFSMEEEQANARPGRVEEKKTREKRPPEPAGGAQQVVIVGIDIPLSNIVLLFLKLLLAVVPAVLILGALLGVVWKVATHGTL